MLWTAYFVSLLMLYWIYDGYGRFLSLIVRIRRLPHREKAVTSTDDWLPVTVLLTVHNEEATVETRVRNLLECDYPADRLQVLVANDGSTDGTAARVRALAAEDSRISLFQSSGLGKTATQNLAVEHITSDIVVLTDADIRFDRGFLKQVVRRFADPDVGAVDGRLLYGSAGDDPLTRGQGFYWRYELNLRLSESTLGLLAVLAGACFAVRRSLLKPMDPSIGEDCIVPLDVVSQGYRVVHEPAATAWDSFDEGNAFAFRRRIRMTLRNWQGTWSRPRLLNPLRHPGYAFALWSHKLLRWLSPVFLIAAVVSAGLLVAVSGTPTAVAAACPLAGLLGMAVFGWLSPRLGFRIPGAGTAFGFVLANLAFLIGVMRAITGHRIHRYQKAPTA